MNALKLTTEERRVLQALRRSRRAPAADVKRARLIIMLDQGLTWSAIGQQLPCTPDYISRLSLRILALQSTRKADGNHTSEFRTLFFRPLPGSASAIR